VRASEGVTEGHRRRRPKAMACGATGRRWRPDVAARVCGGRASLAAGGGAERCGSCGRWPVATRVRIWCVAVVRVWTGVWYREREREAGGEGERVMVFWLSHVSFISRFGPMEIVVRSSIGYLKPTEITVSFVGRLRLTEIVVPSSVGYLNLTEIIVSFIDQLRQTEVVVLSSVFREANGNYFSR
jgi:hypothetical protein